MQFGRIRGNQFLSASEIRRMTFDQVVVGGGVSGLTAALLLARHGFRVALVESAPRTAQLLRGFSRRGLHFDTGFHYAGGLEKGGILARLLDLLELTGHLEKEPFDADGFDVFRCQEPGFEFHFPLGYPQLRSRLHEAFPRERAAVDAYLGEVQRICSSFPVLDPAEPTAGTPESLEGPTLQQFLDGLTGDPLLKGLLSVHTLLYGVSPAEAPLALHAMVAGPYYQSAHGLKGGGRSLAEAFDAELRRWGVEIFCGAGATGFEIDGEGLLSGVRLAGGEVLSCRGCIATIHPRILLDLMPPGAFRPVYRRRLATLEETPSASFLYAVSDAPLPLLEGRNIFLVRRPEEVGHFARGVESGPLYLTGARPEKPGAGGYMAICPVAERLNGQASAFPGRARPLEYRTLKEEMVRKMLGRIEAQCPELRGRAAYLEGATRLTMQHYCHTPEGSLYGVKHRVGQLNPHPLTRVKGLLLAGQGVAAPGVLGAMISAFWACGYVLGRKRLQEELRCP